jgi:hypothetical protein
MVPLHRSCSGLDGEMGTVSKVFGSKQENVTLRYLVQWGLGQQ